MAFWQNTAKKHAKQSATEYTHEHDQADCHATHWPLLICELTTFQSPAGSVILPTIFLPPPGLPPIVCRPSQPKLPRGPFLFRPAMELAPPYSARHSRRRLD